jgi:hypothetical protein
MRLASRVVSVWLLAVVITLTTAAAAGAKSVEPVTNLHLVSGSASRVEIAWNVGSQPNLDGATIDKFIISRNGQVIGTLVGFNGVVDTSYVDGGPTPGSSVYSVTAVDSTGMQSPPSSLTVAAPQAAPQQSQSPSAGSDDNIQSSNLCQSIIPPDVRGDNQPTAFEMYGCGKGMNAVNDSDPDKIGFGPFKTDKPRPIHDFFQNLFIQLPITLGQTFFLLISALSTWVTLPSTYLGVGNLFADLLQTFNGNPNTPGLIALALTLGLATVTILIVRSQHRKGYITTGLFLFVMAVLVLFLSNPFRIMQAAVDKPLSAYTAVTNESTDMLAGTAAENSFNLTVQPTYNGDKAYNAIRRAENNDWLMFQYLPQCAINFGDFRWAIDNKYPGSDASWCEKFVQVWGANDNDAKKEFKDQLKAANADVYNFFDSGDQGQRVLTTFVSKFALLFHNLLKFFMKISLYLGMMLLLAELLFAVIWLIALLVGTDSTKLAAQRRMRTMFHWLKVPFVLLLFMLLVQAVEAAIINDGMDGGFLWTSAKVLIFEVVVIFGTYRWLVKEHREHRRSMERLGEYRSESSGFGRRLARVGGTALAGFAGYEVAKREFDHPDHEAEEVETHQPSGAYVFVFTGPNSAGGDGGNRHYDVDGDVVDADDAEDAEWTEVPRRELTRVAGPASNGSGPSSSVDDVVDGDIVAEDGGSSNGSSSVPGELPAGDENFRNEGDDRF